MSSVQFGSALRFAAFFSLPLFLACPRRLARRIVPFLRSRRDKMTVPTTDQHQRLTTVILSPTQTRIIYGTVGFGPSLSGHCGVADKPIAIPYRNNYFSSNGVLTSMKVGAQPSDATMTVFNTMSPGTSPPAPADTNQGKQFEVDHLLEMQNIHGAFSVLSKPCVSLAMITTSTMRN